MVHNPLSSEIDFATLATTKEKKQVRSRKRKTAVVTPPMVTMESFLFGWLDGRKDWNHEDWVALLEMLETKGIDCSYQGTREKIGAFLEKNRIPR